MESQASPLFLLYSIAIAQFLVLTLVVYKLLHKDKIHLGLLLVLILSMTFIVVEFLLIWSGYKLVFPYFSFLCHMGYFTIGPCLYGLVLLADRKKITQSFGVHLIPLLLVFIYYVVFSLSNPERNTTQFYQNEVVTEQLFQRLSYILYMLTVAVDILSYMIWIYIYKWSNKLSWNKLNQSIWIVFSAIGVLLLLHCLLLYCNLPFYAFTFCIVICLFGLLGFWLNWILIFPTSTLNVEKYQHSSLTDSMLHQAEERIKNIMETEKPYLDPNLSLGGLAEISGYSTHDLSQIINQCFGKKYNAFVNEYRLNKAIEILSGKEKGKTIQEIAFESGFNSKNTFNRVFKKKMNMTPSQFRAYQDGARQEE